MTRYDDLGKLDELRRNGAISEDEFLREKQRLLASDPPKLAVANESGDPKPWGMEVNSFNMLMHLSQFASFIVPIGGLVLPIVMWATCKDLDPSIDRHGRYILNWIISSFIYLVIFFVLCFVLIGIPLLIALVICSLVFTIMGAVKANAGIEWRYPMSIRFFG